MDKKHSIISVRNLRHYAFHGYYLEEQLCGGWFETDILVHLPIEKTILDDLKLTINYEQLVGYVNETMRTPFKTIEEVAFHIKNSIITNHSLEAKQIQVIVRKLRPAIHGASASTEFIA